MKSFFYLFTILIIIIFSVGLFGQIDLEKTVKKKVNKEVTKTVEGGLESNKEKSEEPEGNNQGENPSNENPEVDNSTNQSPQDNNSQPELKLWSKYDFVAGEKIIFEDNLANEKHGEFPSKWTLKSGNCEIAKFGDDNVIAFMKSKTEISPLMKTDEYLPEIFTIEYDVYFHNKGNEAYYLNFNNMKQMTIRTTKVTLDKFEGEPDISSRGIGWHHIALSFNQRALKVYFDQTRVLNIPNIEKKSTSLKLSALSHGGNKGISSMIRNIRIAEGGVELYDRLMTDGKIITRGIYFDVGKSTLRPESMGVINEIVKMMNEHSDLKFSVEGHTDIDGEESFNQKLSEDRASAVKLQMVQLGIDISRLESKGHGESSPVDDNSTPEGKANNRRVEFIKI